MTKHRHRWRHESHSAKDVSFVCRCGEHISRPTTKKEEKIIQNRLLDLFSNTPDVHKLWFKFEKKFILNPGGGVPIKFRYSGWEFIKRVERFAKTHPEIIITRCDDVVFASSDMVFIPHETRYEWMGVTCIVIPQCSEDPPLAFFLYPHHIEELIPTLKEFQRRSRMRRPPLPKKLQPLKFSLKTKKGT